MTPFTKVMLVTSIYMAVVILAEGLMKDILFATGCLAVGFLALYDILKEES